MDRCIILYESRYGSTIKYVDWLCERLHCEKARTRVWDPARLSEYDAVILAGSVFVSGILGIHFLHRHYDALKDKTLAVLIVGASPQDPEATQALAEKNLRDKAGVIRCFYVRGSWRSKDKSFFDRRLFSLQLKTLEKEQAREPLAWESALLSCRVKEGDWSSPDQLDELLTFLRPEQPVKETEKGAENCCDPMQTAGILSNLLLSQTVQEGVNHEKDDTGDPPGP